jgi:hypothetical protein
MLKNCLTVKKMKKNRNLMSP